MLRSWAPVWVLAICWLGVDPPLNPPSVKVQDGRYSPQPWRVEGLDQEPHLDLVEIHPGRRRFHQASIVRVKVDGLGASRTPGHLRSQSDDERHFAYGNKAADALGRRARSDKPGRGVSLVPPQQQVGVT